MMTAEQLRGSILQVAVEGKLVDRIEQEGTGTDLFNLIQEEKRQLIKECRIKVVKYKDEIIDDDLVYEIPDHWKWCRLGSLAKVVTKGTTPRGGKVTYFDKGIGFIRAENVAGLDKLDLSNLKYVDEETNQGYLSRSILEENDILITIAGTLGRTGLVRKDNLPLNTNQAVSIIRLATKTNIDLKYLIYALNSPGLQRFLTGQKKITAIPNLTLEIIANCLIPLPPLAEQKRIVAKIEELMPFVEQYAAASTKLNALNTSFPDQMRKSILQEAVQGKLVPQDPNDEPASVLSEKIAEEKKRLIKEGKIKKDKNISRIYRRNNKWIESINGIETCIDDEISFDIPFNWSWVRLNEMGDYKKGPFGSALTKSMFVPAGSNSVKVYEQKNAIQKNWTLGEYYIRKEYYNDKMTGFTVSPGDVIVSCAGTIGETYIMPDNIELGIINQALMRMKIFEPMNVEYFLMYFDYVIKESARKQSKGSAIRNIPPFAIFKRLLFPVPPLNEQGRILKKLSKITREIDKLGEKRL